MEQVSIRFDCPECRLRVEANVELDPFGLSPHIYRCANCGTPYTVNRRGTDGRISVYPAAVVAEEAPEPTLYYSQAKEQSVRGHAGESNAERV